MKKSFLFILFGLAVLTRQSHCVLVGLKNHLVVLVGVGDTVGVVDDRRKHIVCFAAFPNRQRALTERDVLGLCGITEQI